MARTTATAMIALVAAVTLAALVPATALYAEGSDVVTLTEANFEEMVIKDDSYWMAGAHTRPVLSST
jgi:hypothetical protein